VSPGKCIRFPGQQMAPCLALSSQFGRTRDPLRVGMSRGLPHLFRKGSVGCGKERYDRSAEEIEDIPSIAIETCRLIRIRPRTRTVLPTTSLTYSAVALPVWLAVGIDHD